MTFKIGGNYVFLCQAFTLKVCSVYLLLKSFVLNGGKFC